MLLKNYVLGEWKDGVGNSQQLFNAVNGDLVAEISSGGLNFKEILEYGRKVGGKNLREMTFHDRGRMLKKLAQYLMERKNDFYPLSFKTGATKIDSWIDIEGGISTLFTYASKGRRDLPDEKIWPEGNQEVISKNGTFTAQHVCVPLEGIACHINAYNFPIWGMLEKLAPTFIAGMPAIVKPAPISSYLAHKMVEVIIESEILPEGALQYFAGDPGDLFNHFTSQDVVTFTGSAGTGKKLKSHPTILENNVRFNMEADSINCSILAPDVTPEMDEFGLFVKEVANEMTTKAGQKCTAIRRVFVPISLKDEVISAIKIRLEKTVIGDPLNEKTRMGSLADKYYLNLVNEKLDKLKEESEVVFEGSTEVDKKSSFFNPVLLYCASPSSAKTPHEIEAFGPVSTVMPYHDIPEVIELAKKGEGSLVASLFTADNDIAKEVVLGIGAYHGRIMIINKDSAKESTGHGSPLPHLTHGGPGRAGGGEEMGGIRGIMKYMQRVALQGHPTTLSNVCNQYLIGAEQIADKIHPFRKYFDELVIGETLVTHRRTVTEADIVNFAGISGDYFYAHTDDVAAKNSIFDKRVAHGYFVLSAAAGLFVHPAEGPVLANYGLEGLRFTQPVYIGDTIHARLTCKRKTEKEPREDEKLQGVVEWYVEVVNQDDEVVALYTILTLVERKL
ncbi:MAG: phenylacetic acid degradation bifunctional protein PaaZ [Melioribacteraceae bacterium]|nr:phenylacetic acid degradation bifunctional protein PaaZ [Melioribacteraceae bacterium]